MATTSLQYRVLLTSSNEDAPKRNKARYVEKNVVRKTKKHGDDKATQPQRTAPRRSHINPAGIIKKLDHTTHRFACFLHERYKALKDARHDILERDGSLEQHASGYEILGMRHHFYHHTEYFEWAPGATSCSLIGDFNNWDPSINKAAEGPLGRDDTGKWRITVEDELHEGEEEDPYWQEYNYTVEQDCGDGDVDVDAMYNKVEDEYWEPGEDQFLKDTRPFEEALFKSIFGPNYNTITLPGDENVNELAYNTEDEDTMDYSKFPPGYEQWVKGTDQAHLPPLREDPTHYTEPTVIDDPVWRERVLKKKWPLQVWQYTRKGYNAWREKYAPGVPHASRFRVFFSTPQGPLERVPAWAKYVLPDPDGRSWSAVNWDPPPKEIYQWRNERPRVPKSLRIYECHVGISSERQDVATFQDVVVQVLPHVKKAGYNVVQLIGVQEHADYSSFGYKVTNAFAVSSRFGTPEDFKCLVDTAHGLGLLVFMDIIHSHFSPDEGNGLALFDGASDCFFNTGKRGCHKRWGTRLFNYEEHEVKRFLFSNLKWWIDEYRVDGFYFHSVGSMLYTHNGFAQFTGDFDEYCNQYVDRHAQIYLILANELLHNHEPRIVTIAEDATMYPGLCAPREQGGLGFDYYVSTAPSDLWLWLVQEIPLKDWSVKQMTKSLMSISKTDGKALVYVENHGQSLSGGKSLFQALLDKDSELPQALNRQRSSSIVKMIKLLTVSLGGSAYLNFMGNEFCHPECVEFPRAKNNLSYEYARRKWSLLEQEFHAQLGAFDKALMKLERSYSLLSSCPPPSSLKADESSKMIIFMRGTLVFVFNFHTSETVENCSITVDETGRYELLLDTDNPRFGGEGRLKTTEWIDVYAVEMSVKLPQLSAQVYRLAKVWDSSMLQQRC